ncbi:acyl carrier protein [Streptosporangium sp. NPDC000396]|uniref:acyl carrier protein n=1 Tax=Streptosporangium sp. NPDC000396 TaxID=3366185 RepID=UPI0036980565
MTPQQARELIKSALSQVAPDADLAALPPDADFRDILELDSLDFLKYVEILSGASGYRIEEDDYPAFTTVAGGASFLATRTRTG